LFVSYYKLNEQPFGVTPNPRFLYLTPLHREAMASILYGVMENRGFSALVAPPGMGKTTLLFELLQRSGDSFRTVFLFQFQPSPEGLLRSLLSEISVPSEGMSFEAMQEKLNDLILQESKNGKRIVVVVDEAQNFREPVLEVLRMLSNFETSQDKLIHIILSGQPQLAEMLSSPAIEQLRQRISIMAALRPLSPAETKSYIEHRLRVAGHQGRRPIFTAAACERIAQYSRGIPRTINNLCFNALSLGCALREASIDRNLIDEVFRDLDLERDSEPPTTKAHSTETNVWSGFTGPVPSSVPAMWSAEPPQPRGRNLGFMAGVVSLAAVLFVGAMFAKQYGLSLNPVKVSLQTPAPPAPRIEIAPTPPGTERELPSEEVQTPTGPEATPDPVPVAAKERTEQKPRRQRTRNVEESPVKLVRVAQRQTLYELCSKNSGPCDINAISEIRRLNPRLRNATHVESGEAVLMPLTASEKRRARYYTKSSVGYKP
jgi:type II secretory pathway predicted ATPase ExeA